MHREYITCVYWDYTHYRGSEIYLYIGVADIITSWYSVGFRQAAKYNVCSQNLLTLKIKNNNWNVVKLHHHIAWTCLIWLVDVFFLLLPYSPHLLTNLCMMLLNRWYDKVIRVWLKSMLSVCALSYNFICCSLPFAPWRVHVFVK